MFYDVPADLVINAVMSIIGFFVTYRSISKIGPMFIKANLFGIDMNKPIHRHNDTRTLGGSDPELETENEDQAVVKPNKNNSLQIRV